MSAPPSPLETSGAHGASGAPEALRAAPRTGIGPAARAGIVLAVLMPALVVAWMQTTVIGGAVLASGEVVVRGQAKDVQSAEGGVVAEIPVVEGQRVEAGQPLLLLDPRLVRIEIDIAAARLADAALRERRLEAEIAGADAPVWDDLPAGARPDPTGLEGQRALFEARRAVRAGQREGLETRVATARSQIAAAEARIVGLEERLDLARAERARLGELVERGLAPRADLAPAAERAAALSADLAAERARADAARAGIREARLEVVQAERRFREEAAEALRAARLERAEHTLELARLKKRLARRTLNAPADGIVHELRIAAPGAVLAPGEAAMRIVPVGAGLQVAVRIEPRAIDEVHVGQPARLMLPGLADPGAQVAGRVAQVPPAARTDPATGLSHYRLLVEIPPAEMARLGAPLVPGMPVEAFLATADRSMLSYLLSPLTDQLRRAFREG